MKKRGPGRPRLGPDPVNLSTPLSGKNKATVPSQIMLTDALSKINNSNASHTVR